MKNAFGGLLNEHRHWTHPVIHETLVDLLMIQKKIHRGVFAVMDGTFAGDGPGPRCMVPHVKNVILASHDQVAIDAVAAKLMGFDPLSIKFIRLAHDLGSAAATCATSRSSATRRGEENWHFDGPFKKMTFASRMQHRIYWGPLKKPVEWSLKTWLAPWAYIAVVYHDASGIREGQAHDARRSTATGGVCSATGNAHAGRPRLSHRRRRHPADPTRTGMKDLCHQVDLDPRHVYERGAGVRYEAAQGRERFGAGWLGSIQTC